MLSGCQKVLPHTSKEKVSHRGGKHYSLLNSRKKDGEFYCSSSRDYLQHSIAGDHIYSSGKLEILNNNLKVNDSNDSLVLSSGRLDLLAKNIRSPFKIQIV